MGNSLTVLVYMYTISALPQISGPKASYLQS